MNKLVIGLLGVVGIFALIAVVGVGMYFTYSNAEIRLRNAIEAKQQDNKNQMDAMWKTISQVAQVSEKDRNTLMQIFNGYAQARTGTGDNAAIMNWIKESVPSVDSKTFDNLQNIIVAQRDNFKFRQSELLDLNREHNNCLTVAPSSWFCSNRPKIDVVIVTSTKTEDAFKSGKDDDVNLFQKTN